ncbi:MAG: STAS/SEC14 domain-containing protein [Gammaproteobacteria bacterium]|nr:STAS/SEC14 domain-containing protein [Gammaproteobacteria bacterium]
MNISVIGKLKHEDYELMVPLLENAIKDVDQPHIKVLVDLRGFQGWELRAAWDDLKLGLKHNREFSKIAMLGNKDWEKLAARITNWFSSGEISYFEDKFEALDWLQN